jgi:hypothetical protein
VRKPFVHQTHHRQARYPASSCVVKRRFQVAFRPPTAIASAVRSFGPIIHLRIFDAFVTWSIPSMPLYKPSFSFRRSHVRNGESRSSKLENVMMMVPHGCLIRVTVIFPSFCKSHHCRLRTVLKLMIFAVRTAHLKNASRHHKMASLAYPRGSALPPPALSNRVRSRLAGRGLRRAAETRSNGPGGWANAAASGQVARTGFPSPVVSSLLSRRAYGLLWEPDGDRECAEGSIRGEANDAFGYGCGIGRRQHLGWSMSSANTLPLS